MSSDAQSLEMRMANAIRFLAADAVQAAKSGHPGMPMGMADVATVLFSKYLKFDAANPGWPDRDRFVLSAGHGSMLLYSLLHLTGFDDMTMDELRNFRQLGSKTAGHPEYGHARGIETTTGPLGQGIANAVGMAFAERLMNARYGDDLVDHHTYAIAGDGCLMEGISQEAISLAGHLKLSKLIVFFDDNGISIDGGTELAVSDDQKARFEASGWHVQSVDGHDHAAVAAAIEKAQASDKPSMIACKTTIGFGAPSKAGTASTHGAPLGDEEIAGAREALGWDAGPFEVPGDVLENWRTAGSRGGADREAWEGRLASSAQADEFKRAVAEFNPVRALELGRKICETHLMPGSDLDINAAVPTQKAATRWLRQYAKDPKASPPVEVIRGAHRIGYRAVAFDVLPRFRQSKFCEELCALHLSRQLSNVARRARV